MSLVRSGKRCPGASRGCFLKTLNPHDADIFQVGWWPVAVFVRNPEADATNAQFKVESEKLRHNAITEMLLERGSVIVLGFLNGQI